MHCVFVMPTAAFKKAKRCLNALSTMAAVGLWLGLPADAPAQEAVRMSLAGEAAAAARRKAALSPDSYSLRLGPTGWNVAAALALEANDNIQFNSTRAESDLVVRPQLSSRMKWPISDKNSLNLAFGAGYSAYGQHSEFDRFFVTPGSELAFDIYAGDFWINAHERLSITENAYQDPTVTGTADYSQLQNIAGLSSTWDLNKLVLRAAYDHASYAVVTGATGVPDGA